MEILTYLDTHVVLWLYAGEIERLSKPAFQRILKYETVISPLVRLELAYLYETERITVKPAKILATLEKDVGLKIKDCSSEKLAEEASKMSWTRDPFDRMIAAQASEENSFLVTKDRVILKNYKKAIW
jgi:PIN domain nuclease of toxin-antitoxin system